VSGFQLLPRPRELDRAVLHRERQDLRNRHGAPSPFFWPASAAGSMLTLTFPIDLPPIVPQGMRDTLEGATWAGPSALKIDVLCAGRSMTFLACSPTEN
jgi:hypothetical protein